MPKKLSVGYVFWCFLDGSVEQWAMCRRSARKLLRIWRRPLDARASERANKKASEAGSLARKEGGFSDQRSVIGLYVGTRDFITVQPIR